MGIARNIAGHSFLGGRLEPSSVVVDLGAFQGQFSREIIHRYGCRVFAVEPNPRLKDPLERLALPNFTLDPIAISRTASELTLNLFDSRCASLYGPIDRSEEFATVRVPTLTLEQFLAKWQIGYVDLLKVDIEGAELDLLENTPEPVLRRIGQMTVEFHGFMYPEMRGRVEAVLSAMRVRRFFTCDFSRIRTDVLFVNPARPVEPWVRSVLVAEKYYQGVKRIAARSLAGAEAPQAGTA